MAQLYKDQKDIKSSLNSFKKALFLQKTAECIENCEENKTRLRKYVLDWHAAEKRSPSQSLITAYEYYIQSYPYEVDMALWRIDILRMNKSWSKSIDAVKAIVKVYQAKKQTKGKNNQAKLPNLENVLLMQVEIAELSQNDNLKKEAYENYLANSEDQTKKVAISYQLAHMSYENKDYLQAANAFKSIVSMPEAVKSPLRLQAADLALDALVILKNESLLEKWSAEFAQALPSKNKEYATIARKSVFNQTRGQLVQNTDSLQEAWSTLSRIDLKGASEEEQRLYYRNRLVLAEKLHKYPEAREAVHRLLQFKSLSTKDRQWVLSRQAWLAELALDFGTALKVTQKINMKPYVPKAKNLKLALLAELSGNDANNYYQKYIRKSQDKEQQTAVALKLVGSSKDALKTLKKYKKHLINKPEIYSSKLVEFLAAKTAVEDKFSAKWIKAMAKDKALVKTPAYIFAWRHNFIKDTQKQVAKMESHQIDPKTQRKLSRSLNSRVKQLERLEKAFNRAVSSGDWMAQLFTLHHLSKQSQRLYEELLSLPMPEGLPGEQQMQYMQLLSQQAAPYRLKAQELAKKEPDFWQAEKLMDELENKYKSSKVVLRPFVKRELQVLSGLAPEEFKLKIEELKSFEFPQKQFPSLAELERARDRVREQPLDIVSLDELIELEKKSENTNMVNYLTSRRQQIQELKGSTQ